MNEHDEETGEKRVVVRNFNTKVLHRKQMLSVGDQYDHVVWICYNVVWICYNVVWICYNVVCIRYNVVWICYNVVWICYNVEFGVTM